MITTQLAEDLKKQFNPEGSDLRKQQLIMLDMLKKLDSFCKKYNIVYWLSSGTLLGAVRHKGFIPWDDDLDIEMHKKDYQKLVDLRDKLRIETGMMLQDHVSDPEYIAPYAKLRDLKSELIEVHGNDKYYKFKGIYIDIFVRDKASKVTTFISHGCQYISYKLTRIEKNGLRKGLKNGLWRIMHKGLFPILNFYDILFYHSEKYRHIKGSGYYDYILDKEVFPLGNITFENYDFPAPKDTVSYLKRMYGNYMELPPFDKLRSHYGKIIFKESEK